MLNGPDVEGQALDTDLPDDSVNEDAFAALAEVYTEQENDDG